VAVPTVERLDHLHLRSLHSLQELLGVGGQRLHIAALRLGEDRVEDK